jgi:hypothetical protein
LRREGYHLLLGKEHMKVLCQVRTVLPLQDTQDLEILCHTTLIGMVCGLMGSLHGVFFFLERADGLG